MTAGPGGGVWVGVPNMGSVVRIDAATNKVGLVVPLNGWVASDGEQVWIAVDAGIDGLAQAIRIDPDSGKVITAVDLDQDPGECGLAVGLGSVWVATGGLTRIDPATGRIVGRLDLGGDCGNVIVAGGSVWVRGRRSAVRGPDLAAVIGDPVRAEQTCRSVEGQGPESRNEIAKIFGA